MKTSQRNLCYTQTILAVAVVAAIAQARAQVTDEVQQLITPDSSISIGVGGVSGDVGRAGAVAECGFQYHGGEFVDWVGAGG